MVKMMRYVPNSEFSKEKEPVGQMNNTQISYKDYNGVIYLVTLENNPHNLNESTVSSIEIIGKYAQEISRGLYIAFSSGKLLQ